MRVERFLRFGGVGTIGIGVQLLGIAILVNVFGLHYAIATPLAVTGAVLHNFLWHRFWTWRDRANATSLPRTFAAFVLSNGLVSLVGNQIMMAILVGRLGVPVLPANMAAIGTCSVLNFFLADSLVFLTPDRPESGEPRQQR